MVDSGDKYTTIRFTNQLIRTRTQKDITVHTTYEQTLDQLTQHFVTARN